MDRKETKTRLLDAAEQLFAQRGYHNTSLRAITDRAKANIASVNYHFGGKEGLITSVIERRLLPLNTLRLKKLDEVSILAQQRNRPPHPREVLAAFIEPTLHFRTSCAGAGNFITLIGRSLSEPDDTVRTIFLRLISPVFSVLFELLASALEEIPRNILHMRLHFALGALSHTMQMYDRCPQLSESAPFSFKTRDLTDELVGFVSAGMER